MGDFFRKVASEIPLLSSFLYLLCEAERTRRSLCSACGVLAPSLASLTLPDDPIRGHYQAGSLTGAVHLSKNNAGVLRPAQRGQKPRVEQKGKSWLDPDVQ